MKSVPTLVRSALVLVGFILVTFCAPLAGMVSPPGDWYASLNKPAWESTVVDLRPGVDGALPDDGRRRVDCVAARRLAAAAVALLHATGDQRRHRLAAALVERAPVGRNCLLNPDCRPGHKLPAGMQDSTQRWMRCRRPPRSAQSTLWEACSSTYMTARSRDDSIGIF